MRHERCHNTSSSVTTTISSARHPAALPGLAPPLIPLRVIPRLLTILVCLLLLQGTAFAAEDMELVLVDGTVVHGRLNSFTDGVYTIDSNTLGTLRIEAAKVKSMRSENTPTATPEALQSLQTKMEGNAAVMDSVKSLQQDPDFQAILTDKDILRAITAGDLSSLENNQKIQRLLNKPSVREIEQKLR